MLIHVEAQPEGCEDEAGGLVAKYQAGEAALTILCGQETEPRRGVQEPQYPGVQPWTTHLSAPIK